MQFSQERDLTSYTIRSCSADEIKIVAPMEAISGTDSSAHGSDHPVRHHQETARGYHETARGYYEIVLTESFIMTPARLIRNWAPKHISELDSHHLESVTALDPEVILLGTGSTLSFPDQGLMLNIMSNGIGMEVMDTPAACRTYNILMNEGRHVAVAAMF